MSASQPSTVETGVEGATSEKLYPGAFANSFSNRCGVVVIRDDARLCELWEEIVENRRVWREFPWEVSLDQLARNHIAENMNVGDMVRYVPRGFAHIARKLLFAPVNGRMRTSPNPRSGSGGSSIVCSDVLKLAWEIMSDVLSASLPGDAKKPRYVVGMDLIKYPDSVDELNKLQRLLNDSAGGWTHLGQRLDAYKNHATEGLNYPLLRLRDWYAFGSLIPGVRQLLRGVNSYADRVTHHRVPEGFTMVGGPHIDGAKVITALMGDRHIVTTQARIGRRWIKFPVGTDTLAVFPGKQISKYTNYPPTLHRILMANDRRSAGAGRNLSLALSIIDGVDAERVLSSG